MGILMQLWYLLKCRNVITRNLNISARKTGLRCLIGERTSQTIFIILTNSDKII